MTNSRPNPESATLAERLVLGLRLPYIAGCVFVGFVIFGPPVNILVDYLNTLDLARATSAVLSGGPSFLIILVGLPLTIAYLFYAPRYMRTKVLAAEQPLSRLVSKDVFRGLFGSIASPKPQLLIALGIASISSGLPTYLTSGRIGTLPDLARGAVFSMIFGLGIGSLIWTYYASLRGLRRMGDAQLNLRPHYEDSFLGLKPVGSLALSLAGSYFVLLGLILLLGLTSPTSDLVFYASLFVMVLLGVLMFFVPLRTLHGAMVEQKRIESDKLAKQLAERFQNPGEKSSTTDVGQMLMLDMLERKVAAIHTWPFDLNILGKLTIIVLSVTAALLARLIAATLGI